MFLDSFRFSSEAKNQLHLQIIILPSNYGTIMQYLVASVHTFLLKYGMCIEQQSKLQCTQMHPTLITWNGRLYNKDQGMSAGALWLH